MIEFQYQGATFTVKPMTVSQKDRSTYLTRDVLIAMGYDIDQSSKDVPLSYYQPVMSMCKWMLCTTINYNGQEPFVPAVRWFPIQKAVDAFNEWYPVVFDELPELADLWNEAFKEANPNEVKAEEIDPLAENADKAS